LLNSKSTFIPATNLISFQVNKFTFQFLTIKAENYVTVMRLCDSIDKQNLTEFALLIS